MLFYFVKLNFFNLKYLKKKKKLNLKCRKYLQNEARKEEKHEQITLLIFFGYKANNSRSLNMFFIIGLLRLYCYAIYRALYVSPRNRILERLLSGSVHLHIQFGGCVLFWAFLTKHK